MKNLVILSLSTLIIACGSAYSKCVTDYLDCYIGFDGQIRRMKFIEGFGDRILRKSSPQGNIYAGFKVSENSSIEIGHESTITKSKQCTLVGGQVVNGLVIHRAISPIVFVSKAKVKGVHVDWVFYNRPFENKQFQLLGSFGISSLKGTVERRTVSVGGQLGGRNRTMSKRSGALRFMGGCQYLFDSGLGLRGTVSFVRTGRMVIKANDGVPSIIVPTVRPKDSIVLGIGALYSF